MSQLFLSETVAIDLDTLLRVSTLAETYTVWIKGDINWKMIVKNASRWEGFIMKTRQLGTHKINNGVLRTTDCKILSSNTRQINENNSKFHESVSLKI